MVFDINEFLEAISNVLDVIETDIFGVSTNHSKRIAYISNRLACEMDLSSHKQYDLIALSILHDNGASLKILHDNLSGSTRAKQNIVESRKEHCAIGESNIRNFPFLTSLEDVILYHHEKFDGSGFFGRRDSEIPLMSQLINLADTLDLKFDLKNVHNNENYKAEILGFIKEQSGKEFEPGLVDRAVTILSQNKFWEHISDERIDEMLKEITPSYKREMSYEEVREITKTFSYIIDAKSEYTMSHSSGLAKQMSEMAGFYGIHGDEYWKLMIAADLHDLGKLGISNVILDKPGQLTEEEYGGMKVHTITGKESLEKVQGFEDITEWAFNHHERLNGTGYPRGLHADELDFNSRLLACLDIYQALGEDRPYRKAMSHGEAMTIMRKMVQEGLIDGDITEDIEACVIMKKEEL